jgi:putative transposase
MHKHLRRLDRVWIEFPIFFVAACTLRRRCILATDLVAGILVDEWRNARKRHRWTIGSYVIMAEHVHFFCSAEYDAKALPEFMRESKSWTSRRINPVLPRPATAATTVWQHGFFDHLLCSGESYQEKWDYARNNPLRAGLVKSPHDSPYFGRIESLERAS